MSIEYWEIILDFAVPLYEMRTKCFVMKCFVLVLKRSLLKCLELKLTLDLLDVHF